MSVRSYLNNGAPLLRVRAWSAARRAARSEPVGRRDHRARTPRMRLRRGPVPATSRGRWASPRWRGWAMATRSLHEIPERAQGEERPLARQRGARAAGPLHRLDARLPGALLCARDARTRVCAACWRRCLTNRHLVTEPRARGSSGMALRAQGLPARRRHRGFRRHGQSISSAAASRSRSVRHDARAVRRAVRGRGRSARALHAPHRRRRRRQTPRTRRAACVCREAGVKRFRAAPRSASHNHHRAHSLTPPRQPARPSARVHVRLQPLHISAHPLSFPSSNASGSVPTRPSSPASPPVPTRRSPRRFVVTLDRPRLPHHSLHHHRAQPQPLLYRPHAHPTARASAARKRGHVVGPRTAGEESGGVRRCPSVSASAHRSDAKRLERAFGSREKIGRPRRGVFDALEASVDRQRVRRRRRRGNSARGENAARLEQAGRTAEERGDAGVKARSTGYRHTSAKRFGTDSTWARPSRCASRHLFASDARRRRRPAGWPSSSRRDDGRGGGDGFDVRAGLVAGVCVCPRRWRRWRRAWRRGEPAEGARGVDAESLRRRRTRRPP